MTPENESENGVVKNSKEQELDSSHARIVAMQGSRQKIKQTF